MKCPNCKSTKRQVKNGLNQSGSQKYRCNECQTVSTPEPNGYPPETRLLAIRMYVEGNSYNAIARILKVNPQSVVNWVKAYTANLSAAPVPNKPRTAELDELYTFIDKKKRSLRFDGRGSGYSLCAELGCGSRTHVRSLASLSGASAASQTILQRCLPVYDTLYYGAPYEMRPDKLETYAVEAVNADLRHYLKRLARRSRCFSRRMKSLIDNLCLFVYCYNQCQLMQRQYPNTPFT